MSKYISSYKTNFSYVHIHGTKKEPLFVT